MRKTPYFELHITVEGTNQTDMKTVVETSGWAFSNITDDVELGPGPKMYATIQLPIQNVKLIEKALNRMVDELQLFGHNVVRKKIECVVYDKKVKECQNMMT